MTLEDIGNLGEAISSIGLLITIIFLIIEMKWSRRESTRQHRQQIFQSNLELELSLVGQKTRELEERWSNATSGLAIPYDKGALLAAFTAEELDILKCRMHSAVWQANMAVDQRLAGSFSEEEWGVVSNSIRATLSDVTRDYFDISWSLLPKTKELVGLK